MDALVFYLFYVINWIITLLPLRVLYVFSSFLYLLLYYFPGYRRDVVRTNLRNSFPEKSDNELGAIEKKFYSHLADMLVESIKLTHMSRKELRKRIAFENPELLDRLYYEGRNIVAVLGHYNNWEWLGHSTEIIKHNVITVYKPLKNKYFDRFFKKIRTKYGAMLTPMSSVIRDIITCRQKGQLTLSLFVADQIPARHEIRYWTTFLNQDTAFYMGAGKIASKFNMAVVFFEIKKIKRGYYRIYTEMLVENAGGMPEEEITGLYVKRLEAGIRKNPEFWTWSHRRWKHKREDLNG